MKTRLLIIGTVVCLAIVLPGMLGNYIQIVFDEHNSPHHHKVLQKTITAFESYNKSIKMLLDMCNDVESENDFRVLESLLPEFGGELQENISNSGVVIHAVSKEPGKYPVLESLLNESDTLVNTLGNCMDMQAANISR